MIDRLRALTSFESVGDGDKGALRRRLLQALLLVFSFVVNLALWYGVGRLVETRLP